MNEKDNNRKKTSRCMKRNVNYFGKYGILFLVFFLHCVSLFAYDFEAGGLYYDILSGNTVEVTSGDTKYAGEISIPSSVTNGGRTYSVMSIGNYAFYACSGLTSVTIPYSVTSIGGHAFYGCSSLISVTIPNSVIRIGDTAFGACRSLTSITVDTGNTVYDSRERCNAIIKTESNELICGCMITTIPNSVTSIGDNAFSGCSGLTSVTIPNSVTSIGKEAFYNCSGLISVISEIENPFYISDFVFTGISKNSILTVPKGTKELYKKVTGWTQYFSKVVEDIISYSLTITATGNGSASYNGTTIRGGTTSFTVNEGTNATITFTPDNGCRIKSVKVNNSTVTVSNNQYTVSNIRQNTTVEVEFEAIPITTYTLSVTATGNGSASFNGTTIRSKTSSFTVNEGTNATITFTPDNGYRIKSVKVNNSTVTVSNNQYTVNNIRQNTTVAVEFEAIPPTTYTLSVTSSGNGSASYNGTTIRGRTTSFTVNEGSNATITFSPDNGYRIKSLKVNGSTVLSTYAMSYTRTISDIRQNTTVAVEFEAIPITTYTLFITATGNGSASYNGTTVRSMTASYTVNEGSNATITFSPDTGYRIKSVKVNNTTVSISSNQYTESNISRNTRVAVEFEAIPPTTYTLSITATGSGSVSYNGTSIRRNTSSFTVNEGTNATITFTPDNGYRIKSVKVNGSTVTVSNNQYTVSNISRNTTVAVEFEVIPITTYTLSITATGNGSASYNGTTVRARTTSFTVNEGTNATIKFTPDNGYRIKSVKVNGSTVTVSDSQYTIVNFMSNTTVAVEFEAIPPTTYTLSITATGSGSASYNGTTIRGRTTSFTVNEGTNATITFSPDNGYRIKSVKVNNTTVTVSNNQYTVNNISKNTTVSVEFEVIPPTTYTLSITATGSGYASYGSATIRGGTTSFTVNEGTDATITFSPDKGCQVKSVKVNGRVVSLSNNQYTIGEIRQNTTVEVEFEIAVTEMAVGGVSYRVVSLDNRTVRVTSGDYGQVLRVPTTVSYQGLTFTVVGIENGALANATELAAVVWEPQARFTGSVSNPNMLLYVSRGDYAPAGIQNVVVDGTAERIVLTEAQNGNDFYCPEEFTARSISLTHQYGMTSGMGVCQGWESIVLPFEVQRVAHESKGTMVPFAAWVGTESEKPFWLYELGAGGWAETTTIRANVPYIISVPNHQNYRDSYRLPGHVTFSAENATVKRTDEAAAVNGGGRTLVPNFRQRAASNEVFALNVVNQFDADTDGAAEGSQFVRRLRQVHPFEAYMTATATTRGDVIPVFEDLAMHNSQCTMHNYESMIKGEGSIYTLDGRKLDEQPTKKGVYIMNGNKVVVK